ncbi:unnamed protein product [Dovyalis caffra]|uniref:Galectin n=1 Tax=Dovyalis caffra TaxID=77055 RepID=A0AAV1QTG1_9ROSI|nr:unnamed protein product [Dovyalis caffra]
MAHRGFRPKEQEEKEACIFFPTFKRETIFLLNFKLSLFDEIMDPYAHPWNFLSRLNSQTISAQTRGYEDSPMLPLAIILKRASSASALSLRVTIFPFLFLGCKKISMPIEVSRGEEGTINFANAHSFQVWGPSILQMHIHSKSHHVKMKALLKPSLKDRSRIEITTNFHSLGKFGIG